MPKKSPHPATALAEGMLASLHEARESPSGYPLSVQELIDRAGEAADEATAAKALGRKEFKDRVVIVDPKDRRSPVALQEDLEQLAGSPQLLEFLKAKTARSDGEPFLLKDLLNGFGRGKQSTELKKAFEAAVRRKIERGEIADVALKKPDKATVLAQRLLKVLESQRPLGAKAYPLSLQKLAELAEANPARDEKLISQAIKKVPFKDRAVSAWQNDLAAPVALAEDLERLARHPRVWEFALRAARTGAKGKPVAARAFPAKTLAGKLDPRLRPAFSAAAEHGTNEGALPPDVGAVRIDPKMGLHFFLLEDLQPAALRARLGVGAAAEESPPAPPPAPAGAGSDAVSFEEFARRFEETFSRLDRQRGGHNFVSLADLRRELNSLPRPEFDAHLRRLRLENRFTLSGAQSKQGLPDEVREAGINEAGHLLTYVSRRK